MAENAPDQERFESGNVETTDTASVVDQAATEVGLDMPLAQQAGQNRQQPRSGEGEGHTADSSNETETGQSATMAPKKGE